MQGTLHEWQPEDMSKDPSDRTKQWRDKDAVCG